ncbi:hypothetical protein J8V57_14095 [Xenorhabdus sp. PB61.4]|uniref:gp53-like domain-containing protein n=1 Tax=Xenorhabdus sp. PB61.4 TaxID=2788940 RepID=UPI001E5C2F89|nr:hypothetical protein [Xenorhabdus sp. PB61.4]MCC8367386.1 hypothetical protein [Xenorhabdus sp. PB61.4]
MSNQNDFKAFATGGNANIPSQEDYQNSPVLDVGFTKSLDITLLNKALRQSSTMSSVLANFISTQCDENVFDNGDVSSLNEMFNDALKNHEKKQFPNQLMQNGYQELPNGLMIQWGMHQFEYLVENTVILPKPFKNAILNINIIDSGSWIIPMAGYTNGTLNSFRAWVAGRFFDFEGKEWELKSITKGEIGGQYLVLGY